MRRFLLQIVSIPMGFLVGLFYWIGSQTFSGGEKTLAGFVLIYCVLLLLLALGNFFSETLFWPHVLLTLGAILIVVGTLGYAHIQDPALKLF
jgi:hypothetical protein